jgi:tetraacyldisaccharide 4'-kinase
MMRARRLLFTPRTPLQREPPLRGSLVEFLAPLAAWFYARAMARINRRYDRRRGVVEFDRPVISVGNLSVGGTGKTPMVVHLVRLLRREGHHPAVAMRGYKAGAGQESDEAQTYARAFPDLPLVARADRTEGLIELFATPEGERVDGVVLDDGFQHRKIWRVLDIVLIDATADPFDDDLLPLGWLREPVESLSRAGVIMVTHAESARPEQVLALVERLGSAAPHAVLGVCRHSWTGLRMFSAGVDSESGVEWLRGKRVAVSCAIGNPMAFVRGVREGVGSDPLAMMVLPDHDPYAPSTVGSLLGMLARARPDALVVTDKDWSKLRGVDPSRWPCPVVRPVLALSFDRGEAELRRAVLEAMKPEASDDDD